MTAYRYKAISKSGAPVTGVIEAYDEFDAVEKIKQTCAVVEKITAVPDGHKERFDLNEPLWVSEKVLSMTCSQFSILLRAGLPIVRTVEVVASQTTDKLMRKILTQVASDVSAGYGLAQSLESRGKKIPLTFIETIRAGEESGTLEASFAKLHVYYDKSSKLKGKVRSAMMYPIFLCVLAVAVISIVMVVTVPIFIDMFGNSDQLPLPTKLLIAMTDFITAWWWLVLAVIAGLLLFLRLWGKTEKGKLALSKVQLRIPILGKISRLKATAQFANTMSTLLTAGLPVTRALSITGKVMDNYTMGVSTAEAVSGVEEGKRIGDVLRNNRYFPSLLVEMTAVGEESGALEDTLATIGAYYDSEAERASAKALSMLEPAITVIMGVMIAFIVIALYLPMFSMEAGGMV